MLPATSLVCASLLLNSIPASGQSPDGPVAYIVDTVVGSDPLDPQWAVNVSLETAYGIGLDASGGLWVVDTMSNRIWRATPDGRIKVVAGTGDPGDDGDGGPAVEAQLNSPRDIAFGPGDRVYISDAGNRKIRVISPDGRISSLPVHPVDYGEDVSNPELLNSPSFLSYDPRTRRLYVGETRRVRYIDENGRLHRFAGTGARGDDIKDIEYGGGTAIDSNLFFVHGILAAEDGSVYIAQRNPPRIWKVDPDGILSVVFDGADTFAVDEHGEVRWVRSVAGLAFDAAGRLHFSDSSGGHIYRLEPDGSLFPITLSTAGQERGPFYFPYDIIFTPQGDIYLSQFSKGVVRRLREGETGQVVVGSLNLQGDGGPATAARLSSPSDISFDGLGRLYIADVNNAVVRRVSESGIIERFAGNGGRRPDASFEGRAAPDVAIGFVQKVAVGEGGVYFLENQNVRVVRPDRGVESVFRIAVQGKAIRLSDIVPDGAGGLYVSSYVSPRIWRFDLGRHELSPVVGNGQRGYPSSPAVALETSVLAPQAMALAPNGDLTFIDRVADIHRVSAEGILTTIAVRTRENVEGAPPAPVGAVLVDRPRALTWGPDGALYIAEQAAIRRITFTTSGKPARIETIAGDGVAGFRGDGGPALNARFDQPYGLAFGPAGRLYIADRNNHRIRVLTPTTNLP